MTSDGLVSIGVGRSERNWTEDFSHENGNYECICCECGHRFMGHKRRVICRECTKDVQGAVEKASTEYVSIRVHGVTTLDIKDFTFS